MDEPGRARDRISIALTVALQTIVAGGLVVFVLRREWEHAFFSALSIALTVAPPLVLRHHRVHIPPEFQLVAVIQVFLALFLGEVRGWFTRFWWWDLALHLSSGFLLGIVGLIAVLLLNRTNRLPPGTRPGFLALFSFTFAVTAGVLWELYEFTMDQWVVRRFEMTTAAGVIDTMTDLIADAVGALIVSLLGWAYLRMHKHSFIVEAIRRFIDGNPRLFGG